MCSNHCKHPKRPALFLPALSQTVAHRPRPTPPPLDTPSPSCPPPRVEMRMYGVVPMVDPALELRFGRR